VQYLKNPVPAQRIRTPSAGTGSHDSYPKGSVTLKRYITIAGIAAGLVAAALSVGAGGASAASLPCNDQPWGVGTYNDLWVAAGSGPLGVFAGADPNLNENGYYGTYVCAGAPYGESSQVAVAVSASNPSTSPAGATVQAHQCYTPLPDVWGPCGWLVQPTGAYVDPATTTNAPLNSTTAGSGGTVGLGSGTCVHVNNTSGTCPFGFTVGGVTVNESDALVPTTHPNAGGCVTVGGSCLTTVPSGMGVNVLSGDSSNDTVTVQAGPVSRSEDLGGCYGVNAGTGC
jgi:hypothetical protein